MADNSIVKVRDEDGDILQIELAAVYLNRVYFTIIADGSNKTVALDIADTVLLLKKILSELPGTKAPESEFFIDKQGRR
jgi:hypothetical protein